MPIRMNVITPTGHENIPVIAYDFTTREEVGRFDSISQATRRLFIRSPETVCKYLQIAKSTRKKRGVLSYKDDKRYHFEKVLPGQ